MRAGQLRHRIHIQAPLETRDTDGTVLRSDWTTVAIRWASIEYLAGRELFQAQQAQSRVSTRIRCRYAADVTSRHRVGLLTAAASASATATGSGGADSDFSKIFNIEHANNVQNRNRELELLCIEADPQEADT